MKHSEAVTFVAQIKEGKRFSIRLLTEEWGITYMGTDRFQRWERQSTPIKYKDGDQKLDIAEKTTIHSEAEIVDLLVKWYDFDILSQHLR